MRDTVQLHVGADLPIRVKPLAYANRVEVRFGKAFPVVVLIDLDALTVLLPELEKARDAIQAS
ncbi:hypothetical protein AB0F91_34875 [Amycolatopsis sp. NPDC023774]|jgi:hypothetical protein|uniref:hypothetical protein n=1 Tax=unclassified Amycolatopsis TaxID=2618356 RepID=UPI00340AB8EF